MTLLRYVPLSETGLIAVGTLLFAFVVLAASVACVELEARRQFREREAMRRAAREAQAE